MTTRSQATIKELCQLDPDQMTEAIVNRQRKRLGTRMLEPAVCKKFFKFARGMYNDAALEWHTTTLHERTQHVLERLHDRLETSYVVGWLTAKEWQHLSTWTPVEAHSCDRFLLDGECYECSHILSKEEVRDIRQKVNRVCEGNLNEAFVRNDLAEDFADAWKSVMMWLHPYTTCLEDVD